MEKKIKNMGILGCAGITQLSIINSLKSISDIKIYGIASSSKERALEYAKKYNIPNIYDCYSDLLKDEAIDFVYIPLNTGLHYEWSINAINAKKHVLVEKPACLKTVEFEKIYESCLNNKVYLLEAIMVQFHPWQKYIEGLIKSKIYGGLKTIKTQVSFIPKDNFINNYRSNPKTGGGVFYDLSPYWLQFLQCIGNIKDAEYNGNSNFTGPNGCDWTFHSQLTFRNGIKADFTGSFEMPYKAFHELEFENAIVKMDDFYRANFGKLKVSITIDDFKKQAKETIYFPQQNYYINQLNFFSNVIDGIEEYPDLKKTGERIYVMEKIFNLARKIS